MTYPAFTRINGMLYVEGISGVSCAEQFGTPLYVYSRATLTEAWQAYVNACTGYRASIYFAVKANSNLAVLNVFARLGAGFDIVSGGELARVLAAGGKAENIVFSGVGKSASEMRDALIAGVKCFNVESIPELNRLNFIAGKLGKKAPVSLRVNPDVDANTHPYISTGLKSNKFGVAFNDACATYRAAATMPHLTVIGIDCHIGSQIIEVAPYLNAIDRLLALIEQIEANGIEIRHIDMGGGLGIRYNNEMPPNVDLFVHAVLNRIESCGHGHREVFFEPGRSLTGNAGVLLTRVEFLKAGVEKNFAIVDAAMNDLVRPAMYEAFHEIEPVLQHNIPVQLYDVVGPVCESSDWLGRARKLAILPGDLLAIRSTGAYSFVMSSNYNTRARAAEVMVNGDRAYVVRKREDITHLLVGETIPPD